jgi:hypothetical protein
LVYSQIENLSALSNLADNLSQSSPEVDNETVSNVDEQTDRDSSREKKKDFKNNQYGYTGGKKFTNPPKSKFSDRDHLVFFWDSVALLDNGTCETLSF